MVIVFPEQLTEGSRIKIVSLELLELLEPYHPHPFCAYILTAMRSHVPGQNPDNADRLPAEGSFINPSLQRMRVNLSRGGFG